MMRSSRACGVVLFCLVATACGNSGLDPASFPDPLLDIQVTEDPGVSTAVFGGGCFWCTEAVFEQLAGVTEVVSGYAGGAKENADYQPVSEGKTDHAEVIRITYDPKKISYGRLLKIFFAVAHDPTQLNRQGPDTGRQYRSEIFFSTQEQQRVAEGYINRLNDAMAFDRPIVTALSPLVEFYPAEEYHQDFVTRHPRHPYVRQQALPKVKKLQKAFPEYVKNL